MFTIGLITLAVLVYFGAAVYGLIAPYGRDDGISICNRCGKPMQKYTEVFIGGYCMIAPVCVAVTRCENCAIGKGTTAEEVRCLTL